MLIEVSIILPDESVIPVRYIIKQALISPSTSESNFRMNFHPCKKSLQGRSAVRIEEVFEDAFLSEGFPEINNILRAERLL